MPFNNACVVAGAIQRAAKEACKPLSTPCPSFNHRPLTLLTSHLVLADAQPTPLLKRFRKYCLAAPRNANQHDNLRDPRAVPMDLHCKGIQVAWVSGG